MNVTIDVSKCNECGTCIKKCASDCFRPTGYGILFDGTNCIDCMACTEPDFCPNDAVEVKE